MRHKIYAWYQNYIMASRLGAYDLARRVDGWLYWLLFEAGRRAD